VRKNREKKRKKSGKRNEKQGQKMEVISSLSEKKEQRPTDRLHGRGTGKLWWPRFWEKKGCVWGGSDENLDDQKKRRGEKCEAGAVK